MVRKQKVEDSDVFLVDPKSTLEQACNILFKAEHLAETLNDVDSLMKIAAGWMELHEYLNGRPDEAKKQPLGFTGGLRNQEVDGQYDDELADAVADTSDEG